MLLLLAQVQIVLHPLEHLRPDANPSGEPPCVVCIALHGFDAVLPPTPIVLPAEPDLPVWQVLLSIPRSSHTSLHPRQRGPPSTLD